MFKTEVYQHDRTVVSAHHTCVVFRLCSLNDTK